MIWLVNVITIIGAIYYAVEISQEKKAYFNSIMIILIGFLAHALKAFFNDLNGECEFSTKGNLLLNIDRCIDYESGSMIVAQAAILAGFVVIFVKLALKNNKQIK